MNTIPALSAEEVGLKNVFFGRGQTPQEKLWKRVFWHAAGDLTACNDEDRLSAVRFFENYDGDLAYICELNGWPYKLIRKFYCNTTPEEFHDLLKKLNPEWKAQYYDSRKF